MKITMEQFLEAMTVGSRWTRTVGDSRDPEQIKIPGLLTVKRVDPREAINGFFSANVSFAVEGGEFDEDGDHFADYADYHKTLGGYAVRIGTIQSTYTRA